MSQYPLRLVLVDRRASHEGGWLKQIKDDSEFSISQTSILNLRDLLLSREHRVAIFAEMVKFFDASMPENTDEIAHQLAKASCGNDPLYIMMAAMRWIDTSKDQKQTLSLNSLELSKYVAGIEQIRFDKSAKIRRLNKKMLTHLAAFVTLADGDRKGIGQKEFIDFILQEKQMLKKIIDTSSKTQRLDYFDALKTLLPQPSDDDKRLHGILPDVIGETFIMNTLDENEVDDHITLRCYEMFSDGTIQTLVRMAQDFKTEWPLRHLEVIFKSIQNNHEKLTHLARLMPSPTQILAKFSADIWKKLTDILRPLATNNKKFKASLANSLNTLGDILGIFVDIMNHFKQLRNR